MTTIGFVIVTALLVAGLLGVTWMALTFTQTLELAQPTSPELPAPEDASDGEEAESGPAPSGSHAPAAAVVLSGRVRGVGPHRFRPYLVEVEVVVGKPRTLYEEPLTLTVLAPAEQLEIYSPLLGKKVTIEIREQQSDGAS